MAASVTLRRVQRAIYRGVEHALPWVGWFFLIAGLAGAIATVIGAGPRLADTWGLIATIAAWLVLAVEGFQLVHEDAEDDRQRKDHRPRVVSDHENARRVREHPRARPDLDRRSDVPDDTPTLDEMTGYLRGWAQAQGCYFDEEAECGFGREAVGITRKGSFIDLYYLGEDYRPLPASLSPEEVGPPEGVTDAYHKHDCLAVLGRGGGAIRQLYLWVKHLAKQDIRVEDAPRRTADLSALMGSRTVPILTKDRARVS